MKNLIRTLLTKNIKENVTDISKECIHFAIWVQDNYSQNRYDNSFDMLPKGQMRKDFTNDIYTIEQIYEKYKQVYYK